MLSIRNDKELDKCISIETDDNKPQNIMDSSQIIENLHCQVDTFSGIPNKFNYKRIDNAEVKSVSVKSIFKNPRNISKISSVFGQLRFPAGGSTERSRNYNPYQQKKESGTNISVRRKLNSTVVPTMGNTIGQSKVNISCDNSRYANEYRSSERNGQSLDKKQSRTKRPSIESIERITEQDRQKCLQPRRLINSITGIHKKRKSPKPIVLCSYEPDYYDDTVDMLNSQQYQQSQDELKVSCIQNEEMITQQQSSIEFVPSVNEGLLSDGEQACEDKLYTLNEEWQLESEEWPSQQVEQPPQQDMWPQQQKEWQLQYEDQLPQRYEWEQKQEDFQPNYKVWTQRLENPQPRYKEWPCRQEESLQQHKVWPPRYEEQNQGLEESQVNSIWRTNDELVRVENQRLHLLKSIERHQQALAAETQQLLRNQQKQCWLKKENKNENLEDFRITTDSQISQEEEKLDQEQHGLTRKVPRNLLQKCRRMYQSAPPSVYCNKNTNICGEDQERRREPNTQCVTGDWQTPVSLKGHTPYISSSRLSLGSCEFDGNQLSANLKSTNCTCDRRTGIDVTASLPLQLMYNCEIDQPDEKKQRTVSCKSVARTEKKYQYGQTRFRLGKTRSMVIKSITESASQLSMLQSRSQSQRSQPQCRICGTGPSRIKSSIVNHN